MRIFKGVERAAKRVMPKRWRKYFRASRYELLMERLAPVELIVHVGAHWGEDAAFYEACGARTVLWIEADPETYARLAREMAARRGPTRHLTECALVSASGGESMSFHRFKGDGSSSSVHRASEAMAERFPESGESGEVLELVSRSLPEILARHGIDVPGSGRSMLVLDVQGHEYSVLTGLGDGLRDFSMCKCEVSRHVMYQGGAAFPQIDAHMKAMGFRLASHWYVQVPRHGDVLYLREDVRA
ncbi:FkbM family methyltransferase [Seohaeicola nanhaiensis]|uniref:FkbM family methyltransferase n=1 Tax=Seohaeicola nanhaiensis TaxID=1387282 RepID=A0ABV9KP93_9RHOB